MPPSYDEQDTWDVLTYGTCGCGKPGVAEHQCPYDVDINNNPDSFCNCCDICCGNCSDDI